ncbi:MAG: hypothetical protein CMI02_08680 [Oceanospirillaceae bacterium]|nr:hypothetical protein [Oceanospirillaceae bacterium]
MSKDPAALVYIAQWISATNGMKAEFRAWYFDLLLHQFDNGSVPTDLDEMAGICRVRPSEFERFNQFVNQVVNQKFNQNDNQRLENDFAKDVIQKRKSYKKGKDRSSAMGVVVRYAIELGFNKSDISKLKKHLYDLDTEQIIELKNKEKLKEVVNQLVNQKVNLLIDIDKDEDINNNKDEDENFEKSEKLLSIVVDPETLLSISDLEKQFENEVTWKESLCRNFSEVRKGFNMETLENYLEQFFKLIKGDGEECKTVKDTKKHFNRWLKIEIQKTDGKDKSNTEIFTEAMQSQTAKQFRFK